MPFDNLRHNYTSKEEWLTIRTSANDRTIVIKRTDKESHLVVW